MHAQKFDESFIVNVKTNGDLKDAERLKSVSPEFKKENERSFFSQIFGKK